MLKQIAWLSLTTVACALDMQCLPLWLPLEVGSGRSQAGTSGAALQASAEILDQRYCHSDNDSFSVLMKIRLKFRNASDHRIILARGIQSPGIIHVAKTVEDAQNKRFEYSPAIDRFTKEAVPSPSFGDSPGQKDFTILAAGESYETTVPSGVFGTMKKTSSHGLISRGMHVIQFGVSTWPFPTTPEEVIQLRAKWKDFGYLESDIVNTAFLTFGIPEKFVNPRCSPN